ncbi:MAG: 30S ribosomal protein S16 [Rickettsiales bacterium]|jgi:small subunit ribosomal protein S16|nr:30S ribosomal protein S16 [Rickettsiales bacterium]
MSTKIRLSRAGRRNLPFYHVVIADDRSPRDGKFIEKIGYYDPIVVEENENRFRLNIERAEYWLSVGAVPTDRILVLFKKVGVSGIEKFKPKIRNTTKKTKGGK